MLARQIAIGFGIAIIFPLLVYYGVKTFHPAPVMEQAPVAEQFNPQATPDERRTNQQKQRDRQEAYAAKAKDFARVLIIVSTPLGIAAIFLGTYLANAAVGTGLILGGILTVAHGYWGYWSYADDWLRFVSLLVGLAVLLFVGHHRTRKRPEASAA
jgi:uncharacterized membrane protein YphA (DoxX/SURF4 family)